LKFIFDYYKTKASFSIAHKIKNSCFDRVEILFQNPEAGPIDEVLKELNEGHRYLIEGNYKIIYKINSNTIFITGVFDTRQEPQKIFLKK
jgi:plasmid stabilization system protein ParE